MSKEVRIYLAEQPHPNKGKWEIYKEGTPTGELIGNKVIRRLLSIDQYLAFINGDDIFIISKDKYKARNNDPKKKFNNKNTKLSNGNTK